MALINCPECNHEISDQTVKCPNCGHIVNKKSMRESIVKKCLYICIGILIGVLGSMVVARSNGATEREETVKPITAKTEEEVVKTITAEVKEEKEEVVEEEHSPLYDFINASTSQETQELIDKYNLELEDGTDGHFYYSLGCYYEWNGYDGNVHVLFEQYELPREGNLSWCLAEDDDQITNEVFSELKELLKKEYGEPDYANSDHYTWRMCEGRKELSLDKFNRPLSLDY